jgi:hypothetical protein
VLASDASVKGSVVLTGSGASVLSGSSVAAGEAAASLRLNRGGEVRICPRTSVSVTASPNGRDLMFALSGGAMEAEYALPASADTIMTPDFRILLPGPGNFHFALGADPHGNTCLRALKYNTASLIVSELMGDGSYQVKPNEEVLFRGGKVSDPLRDAGVCGCPPPPAPVLRAQAPKPAPIPTDASLTAPPPAPQPGEVQIQVDAPFVFRGDDPNAGQISGGLNLPARLHALPVYAPDVLPPQPPPPPQPAESAAAKPPAKPRKGFFGHVKSFFAAIFR